MAIRGEISVLPLLFDLPECRVLMAWIPFIQKVSKNLLYVRT